MGRSSQKRMTGQTVEARVKSAGVREKMLAEAKAEEEKRLWEALAAEVKRRREERARLTGI